MFLNIYFFFSIEINITVYFLWESANLNRKRKVNSVETGDEAMVGLICISKLLVWR